MYDQASRIECNMKQITEKELECLGATMDANCVWTLPDGSKGRFPRNPVAVYSNDDEPHKPCGFVYFEKIERIQ
jgi:hypothetical protein